MPSTTEGIVESINVKIGDKVSKGDVLISVSGGTAEVKDEKIADTVEDTINYLVYLYCKYQEAREEK